MFLFTRTWKETLVTAGTILAVAGLIALSIRCILVGGYALVVSFASACIVFLLASGSRYGYILGKLVFSSLAIVCFVAVLSPAAWDDAPDTETYAHATSRLLFLVPVFVSVCYCLQEHASFRGVKKR